MKTKAYDYTCVGRRLKQARKAKRYTQEHVAEQIGVGVQHISDMERGLTGMSLSSLISICRLLEVDADYLLFGKIGVEAHNPVFAAMKTLDEKQKEYAQRLLALYIESCQGEKKDLVHRD